jgi:hypothetical protein
MLFKPTLSILAALQETIQKEIEAKAVKMDEDALTLPKSGVVLTAQEIDKTG